MRHNIIMQLNVYIVHYIIQPLVNEYQKHLYTRKFIQELSSLIPFYTSISSCINCTLQLYIPWLMLDSRMCNRLIYLMRIFEKFTIILLRCAVGCVCMHMYILADHVTLTSQRNSYNRIASWKAPMDNIDS